MGKKLLTLTLTYKKYNGIKRYFAHIRNSSAPDARTQHGLPMEDGDEKLEAVQEFCHLREMLSAKGSCELTVPTLPVCMGVNSAISTNFHQPSSAIYGLKKIFQCYVQRAVF